MSIIVPVTYGKHESYALSRAVQCAAARNEKLVAVLSRPRVDFTQEAIDYEVDMLSDALDEADIDFRVETRLDSDDIATHLIDAATAHDADLILVSLAHKPANGRLNLGTIVQKLLVEAPCDVLVAREEPMLPELD